MTRPTLAFPLVLDDAAIFPPGNLPLADAVAAHGVHRTSWYAELVGPLVVSAAALPGAGGAGDLVVVVPSADAAAAVLGQAPAGAQIVGLEVTDSTVAALEHALGAPEGVTVHVEVPRDERRDALVAALAGTPYRAKLRTGGVRAELYPDEAELAACVHALVRAGVAFKATAGLHHALRNTDPATGFEQHGFLNLLAATAAAAQGAGPDDLAALLAERDADRLPAIGAPTLLGSIGTCSIGEPVAELVGLGLLAEEVHA